MTQPGTVPQRAARAMMREALRRNLVAGDRLASEPALMGYFKVSRGSLREALRVLASLGAIEIRTGPGGGAHIAAPQPQVLAGTLAMALQFRQGTLLTVLEARAAVEPAIARLAAGRRKDDDLAAMRDCLQRLEATVGSGAFTEHDDRFAELVAHAAGNTALGLINDALRGISRTVRCDHDAPTQQRIAQHRRAMTDAIVARDGHGAHEAAETVFTHLLDHQRDADHLATRIVWADVDERDHHVTTDHNRIDDNRKGDSAWTPA